MLSILKHYDLLTDGIDESVESITTDITRPLDLSWVRCDLKKIYRLPTFQAPTPGKGMDMNSL